MRDIWEKFRGALCIPGGDRRAPPTPSLPGRAADAYGDGEEEEEDLLSALPDDVLLRVLLRLPSAAAAARTSVLSRRWRHLWAQLPELRFPHPADLARSRAALAAHAAPALYLLHVVVAGDADPGDAAAVLLLAAPRLTGELVFHHSLSNGDVAPRRIWNGDVDLPCFEKAERIVLSLGCLGLALPLSGVFAKLTVLRLFNIRFHGCCDLGDAVSSARCPLLQELRVNYCKGVSNLAIRSESLISLNLRYLKMLKQLTIVAPMLRQLDVAWCFVYGNQLGAHIFVPVLEMLQWVDVFDPSLVHLSELEHLRKLVTCRFTGYGLPDSRDHLYNRDIVMLLQRFQKIPILNLAITYPSNMVNCQCLMGAITMLPDISSLNLGLSTCGHAIGPCVFHLLKICSGIRKLNLNIRTEERAACSPGCVCHQPQDWETEEFLLNSLQEVNIFGLSGADSDFAFVKGLLGWTTAALKTVTVAFHPSVIISKERCRELLFLSSPESHMEIYLYRFGILVCYTLVRRSSRFKCGLWPLANLIQVC